MSTYQNWIDMIYASDDRDNNSFWIVNEKMLLSEVMDHLSKRGEIGTFEDMKVALYEWSKPDNIDQLLFFPSDAFNVMDDRVKKTVWTNLSVTLRLLGDIAQVDQDDFADTGASGLILGWDEISSRLITLDGNHQGHTLVNGGPGSGKTTTYVIPNIVFEQKRSLIVFGHGEIFDITKEIKEKQGYQVISFDFHDGYQFENPNQVKEILEEIFRQSRNDKVFYYIGIPMNRIESSYLKEAISSLLMEVLSEDVPVRRNSIHLIFDESPYYIDYSQLSDMLPLCASHKIQVSLVIQNLSQLHVNLSKDKVEALLSNLQNHVITGLVGTQEEIQLYKSLIGVYVYQNSEGKWIETDKNHQSLCYLPVGKSLFLKMGSEMMEISQVVYQGGDSGFSKRY
ncbi:hypothetical protein J2Z48_002922 [Croceifilum oryzae]|uniref:TraD/TraG TraM recognition site domain-containing protein n=1 Tax=Croceifilum oryzae TaxID=1553429 RepID=A0AAJ1WTS5_9BACL|nr:type IV secretory system conjugative DNA transfer family protein [Croceifilum oryzae]MDQ0418718.1 hypothetical protein [Croceifilum oryzae]